MTDVARGLRDTPGARHVVQTMDGGGRAALVTAELVDDAVDGALTRVHQMGVPREDVVLVRLDSIGRAAAQRPLASVVWADLLSQAGANARPFARYLLMMMIAGVIAAFGVIYANVTLVVGAMAISPDVLPVTAAATAIVLARWRLAGRALTALIVGLATVCLVGIVIAFVVHQLGLASTNFSIDQQSFLSGLATVNISTPIVALVAGVAAILALETRASSAVGVAISVTTIPASAYLGVVLGSGEADKAGSPLLVLLINVTMLLVGGCVTLLAQRWLAERAGEVTAHAGQAARVSSEDLPR
jgi:uncharacterized hydrophobic protein (TIGR00271 family)